MEPAIGILSSRRLPAANVTFLFTDIEASTPLWKTQFAAMQEAPSRESSATVATPRSHSRALAWSR